MGSEHVIPQFIIRMKKSVNKKKAGKIKFFIKGSGKETRAFNFIDDFCMLMDFRARKFLMILAKVSGLNIIF